MIDIAMMIFLIVMMIWAIILLFRVRYVMQEHREILDEVSRLVHLDLMGDWMWRYDAMFKVQPLKPLLLFWTPVKPYYKNCFTEQEYKDAFEKQHASS